MAWTKLGLINNLFEQQDLTSKLIGGPSVMRICALGTTTPVQLYADALGATTILSDPIATGQPVGTPGIDVAGNFFAWVAPGYYTPVINGVSYAPYQVLPHIDDLAALGGGTTSSGSTLQIQTASTRTITNNDGSTGGSMVSAVTLADWTVTLNPGDTYRFDGTLFVNSTHAAAVRIGGTASGTGVVMGYVIRGPHVSEAGVSDITEHRETTVTSATNGPQQFNGFNTGLSDVGLEILGGFVSLPSSAPAPGSMKWKFAQATATAGVTTTVKDLMSCMSLVKVT